MLHAPPNAFHPHATLPASIGAGVDERLGSSSILDRYLEGWAEADPAKIVDATTEDYEFYDPLVGRYSRRTLPEYFALLASRFAIACLEARPDLAFTLRGPMSSTSRYQYWREAPSLGLTGQTEITVKRAYVATETVAYDLNMAGETLRGCNPRPLRIAIGT